MRNVLGNAERLQANIAIGHKTVCDWPLILLAYLLLRWLSTIFFFLPITVNMCRICSERGTSETNFFFCESMWLTSKVRPGETLIDISKYPPLQMANGQRSLYHVKHFAYLQALGACVCQKVVFHKYAQIAVHAQDCTTLTTLLLYMGVYTILLI